MPGEALSQDVINRALELQRIAQAAKAAQAPAALPVAPAAVPSRTMGDVAADTGLGLLQGAVGLGQSVYGITNAATLGGLDALTGFSENFQQTNQILNAAKSPALQAKHQQAQDAFTKDGIAAGLGTYLSNPSLLGDALATNAPSLLPAAGFARAAGAIGEANAVARGFAAAGAPAASSHAAERAVLATTALQTGGSTNVDAPTAIRDAGGSTLEQAAGGVGAGILSGVAAGAIGKLTGAAKFQGGVFNALPGGAGSAVPGTGIVRGALGGAAKEGTEEYFQSGTQQLSQNAVTPDTPLFEGVAQQSAVGGLIGGLLGGVLGGGAGAVNPRDLPPVRSATPLRDMIGSMLGRSNQQAGDPLKASPLADQGEALLPVENINLDAVPTPDETVNLADTPLPGQAESDTIHLDAVPLPEDNINLADTPLPEDNIDLDAVPLPPDIGTLGSNTDLFGGPLPAAGAVPAEQVDAPAAGTAVAADNQGRLDFVEPGTGWKSFLARDLGIKPQSLRGKAWDDFTRLTEGVNPSDPGASQLLATIAPQLGDPASAPLFAAKLAEKYAPVQQTADPLAPVATPLVAPVAPVATQSAPTPAKLDAQIDEAAKDPAPNPIREVAVEQGVITPSAAIADPVTRQAAVLNQAMGETRQQNGSVPGSTPLDLVAQPIGIDAHIVKHTKLDPSATINEATVDAFSDLMADATSTEALDETFMAIKNHPSWRLLNSAQQTDVAEEFNVRYARVDGGDPGKFQRGPAVATPIGVQDFQNLVATANTNGNANTAQVIPLESVEDFQALTGQAAPQDARGVFSDGKVYLIRQNIGSPRDLAITLAHEQGHNGLDKLLGDRLASVTNRLWTNASLRPQIKAKMDTGLSRSVAAEEVLADMLAGGQKVNGDVLSKARNAIEAGMAKLIGISDLRMDNKEVDALLRDVARVNRGVAPAAIDRAAPHLQGLVNMLADPQQGMAGDARFSRALGDLDRIISDAESDGPGAKRSMNDIAKDAGTASLTYLKDVGNQFKTGGAFGSLLSAVPLNQIESLYHKILPGLTAFVKLKDQKEATTNRLLTQPETLRYRDETTDHKISSVDLTKEWEKFKRTAPAKAEALDNLNQYATLYRLHPEESFEKQSKINYDETSFTEAERKEAHEQVRKLYRAAGEEGQAIFKKAQASYSYTWNRRFTELQKMLARTTGHAVGSPEFARAFGNNINSALGKIKNGAYSPLQRYGDYLVSVRGADGSLLSFEGFDTKALADARAKQLAADPQNARNAVNQPLRTSHDWQRDGINPQTIAQLESVADGILPGDDRANLRKEVREALVEAYLTNLPQQAFLTSANKRKGIAGFTTDTLRAYSDYSMKAARSIASLEFDDQIASKMQEMQVSVTDQARTAGATDTTKAQRVLEAVKAQHQASQDFGRSPTADLLTQGGFVFFMTSPSQFFVNSMQTAMVTLPRLAGTYGSGQALRGIKSAMGALVKSKGDMLGKGSSLDPNSNEYKIMEEMRVRGDLNATYAHDVAGLARGEAGAMSGHWRTAMEITGYAMHKSEQINRQIVSLATARLELDKRAAAGKSGPLNEAELASIADTTKRAIDTTQFNYAQYNKPTLMQGPWRKAIFQFQQYRLNMLAMISKDIRDGFIAKDATPEEKKTARRALAWQLGTQLALTGAAGTVLAPLVFGIMDMFRDDDDLLDSRTEFLRAYPQWLTHGLLSGAVDLERVGSDGLIPILGDRKYAPTNGKPADTFNYYVMQNIGPWAGLLGGAYSGATKFMEGDMVGATKGLLPAPIRDFYKSTYEAASGAKDSRQIVYYEPGVWDTVLGAAGLRSGERKEAEELRGAGYQANATAQTLRQRYLGQLAVGHALGDQDLADKSREAIQEFNTRYPDLAIRGSDIKRAVVNRIRSQSNADQFGVASGRAPSQSILEAIGK